MRVALLSHNARAGDAIGNQLAEKLGFFLERGADVRVFLDSDQCLHAAIRPHCRVITDRECRGPEWEFLASADLILVEYGQYYPLLELLPALVGGRARIVFDYHGITPREFWSSGPSQGLQEGAKQRGLVWCADAAVVHSRFARRELLDRTAFPKQRTHLLGYATDAGWLGSGDGTSFRRWLGLESETLLLYVGRLAPNKRVPVLVESLARLRERTPAVHAIVIGDKGDVYETEARRSRALAEELGIADRLHLLGHVDDQRLRDAYHAADMFVMPSRHEGFCIPVIEALASGLPVVAARAAALPETVAAAGLTFAPDDPEDLARQISRVLDCTGLNESRPQSAQPLRVALVAFRYGTDFAGGAETSLRTIAETLHQAGNHVEVFTTCTRKESNWSDDHAEGSVVINGILVHRHRLDPHDELCHSELIQSILRANGDVGPEIEANYLRTSVHSARLLDKLRQRLEEFDAVIVGPYLFGLTVDVARAFPEKTILLPCLHDEPLARLRTFREVCERVGSILYHSPEEQRFAEAELGLNHPGALCIGTVIDTATTGNGDRGRQMVGTGRRYLVYCGRYIPQKGVDTLCEFAWRYHQKHPGRFTFAFMGQGPLSIPTEPWARDLGFVDEATKRDVLAGADALLLLSRHESLSLVALEAWTQSVPLIADAESEVLTGHLQRCGGGWAVDSYEAFANVLDDLWENPERWRGLGCQGQAYVASRFGSREALTNALAGAIHSLRLPLVERLRAQGLLRAAQFDRPQWREQFGRFLEEVLDTPIRPVREEVEVRPRSSNRRAPAGAKAVLVPVRVVNRGTHILAHQGPARWVLRTRVVDELGQPLTESEAFTPLFSLVPPGRALSVAVAAPVPAVPGAYRIGIRAERADGKNANNGSLTEGWLTMMVTAKDGFSDQRCCAPMLEAAQAALAEADGIRQLPDDYVDVTEGWFATWKRRIKRKFLNNFKKAYVDVLSRQQSTFNRQVLTALIELADCCATLDHVHDVATKQTSDQARLRTVPAEESLQALVEQTLASGGASEVAALVEFLVERLSDSEQRYGLLEERLARLETRLHLKEEVPA